MTLPGRTLVACAIAVLSLAAPAAASDPAASFVHVRPVDKTTDDVVRDGTRRSATFRRLVSEIEQSDVIVYVQMASILAVPVNAHLQMAGATPAARYLRILVKIPAGADNAVALLGHELQHAAEVAHAVDVRDQRAMAALYRRIGDENDSGWETRAARLVDYIIREELRAEARQ